MVSVSPHVIGSLCTQSFQAHPLPSAGQLVIDGAVHAVAIGLDLPDLKLPLGQLVLELEALLMPRAQEILHLRLSYAGIALLLQGRLLILDGGKPSQGSVLNNGTSLNIYKSL